ncbi:MAG: hypothetical protein JNJ58_04805 [Chitinophagaceae bacterium]|nr:hypothetical protein [Chitinophagaceae bacterium]
MNKYQTSISTYHEYIFEAICALRFGLAHFENGKFVPADIGSDQSMLSAELNCRYSFLMISNSLEAAANALLLSLSLDTAYYEELERTSTLVKFKLFCDFSGKRLDQGDIKFGRIKELISCRNEFVHPKPLKAFYRIDDLTSDTRFEIKSTRNRNYPIYFSEIKPSHVLTALEDTLIFISWVCFDICKLDIQDGALRLGFGSYGSTGDIDFIGENYEIKFDRRTFGQL